VLQVGDYVMLKLRERPYDHHDPKWWWKVVRVSDFDFDAVYERHYADPPRTVVRCRRNGVAFENIEGEERTPS
jgi:hypothetical protein